MTWLLYTDESGDFDRAASPRVIVAFGLRDERSAELNASLRKTLEKTVPWVPWPIHATSVRWPPAHLLWRLAFPERRSTPALTELCYESRVFLQQHADLNLEPLIDEIRSLQRVRRLRQSEQLLAEFVTALREGAPDLWKRLSSFASASYESVRHVLRETILVLQEQQTAMVLMAPEGEAKARQPRGDAWLEAFEVLTQRAADIGELGSHRAALRVLGRRVRDPLVGQVVQVSHATLTGICKRVGERLAGTSRPRVSVYDVLRWDRHTPAGAVVADWLANVTRTEFRHRDLAEVKGRLSSRVGVDASGGPLPNVAAVGSAAELLEQSRRGEMTTLDRVREAIGEAPVRPWAAELSLLTLGRLP